MTQFEFTRALLEACKEEGIHTALDTCGHVPTERYLDILPPVDLFLYDYKETDNEKHRYYMGVDKARKIGAQSRHMSLKSTEKVASQRWVEQLVTLGCDIATIG